MLEKPTKKKKHKRKIYIDHTHQAHGEIVKKLGIFHAGYPAGQETQIAPLQQDQGPAEQPDIGCDKNGYDQQERDHSDLR